METTLLIALIATIVLIIYLVTCTKSTSEKKKEGFFNAAGGAYVDENTGVIKGNILLSDGQLYGQGQATSLLNDVRDDQYYAVEGDFGAKKNKNNFNSLMENQLAIQNINNKNDGNVMSQSDMRDINKRILSAANNSKFNLFDRAGDKAIEFSVQPSGTVAVIDGDYLGERDRNNRVVAARRVIPVKAFDMSIDRIPQQMTGPSGILGTNKKSKPKDSSAALKGGQASQILDAVLPSSSDSDVKKNFEQFRASGGILVHGNYNN